MRPRALAAALPAHIKKAAPPAASGRKRKRGKNVAKAKIYGIQDKQNTRRPQDMRYQRQQRQRQQRQRQQQGATRKPVAGQIIKEKEAAGNG